MSLVVPLTPSMRPSPRIHILGGSDNTRLLPAELASSRVFVTIGPAETHVSVMNDEGVFARRWTAVFGWSFLLFMPVVVGGRPVFLEDEETLALALAGDLKVYGEDADTPKWRRECGLVLTNSVDDILRQTVGSGARFAGIVFAAPEWLHDLLAASRSLRPHILQKIIDI